LTEEIGRWKRITVEDEVEFNWNFEFFLNFGKRQAFENGHIISNWIPEVFI